MRTIMKRIFAIFLVLLLLTGCSTAPTAPTGADTRPSSLPDTSPAGDTTQTATLPPETETVPETTVPNTVPPETTPPETTPPEAASGYSYDPYLLSQEARNYFSEEFQTFYRQVVDAYLKGEAHVTAPDDDSAQILSLVLSIEFPMFAYDADYNYFGDYNRETREMTISYATTPEEHQAWVRRFTEAANEFLAPVHLEDSDQLRAETLYHAFCTQMTYDYAGMETRENVAPWNAIVDHSGVCYSFAEGLRVLLTQIGVSAYVCSGETETGAHVWLLTTLEGKNYFLDPTFELSWKDGTAFVYFGETLAERFADGVRDAWISIGSYDILDYRNVEISDAHLQVMSLPD